MDLKLVISLALCHSVWGWPQSEEAETLQEAISNLQLLNQIMVKNTIAEQSKFPKKFRPFGAPQNPLNRPSLPHVELNELKTPQRNQKYSLDGPFSDIPSDAFKLEHRKEFPLKDGNKGRVSKKDLSWHEHKHALHTHNEANKVPENLIRTCLNYFQGRSQPQPSSLELIMNICTELLDTDGVNDFVLDDEKRQQMYDFRANEGTKHHHHIDGSVECECCPYHHQIVHHSEDRNDEDDKDIRSDAVFNDILGLFKPIGQRREWMVINSQNPNERLRTYIDVKK